MQTDYALWKRGLSAILVAAAQRIMSELPPTMSGSLRAQHLGIYYVVVTLTELEQAATANAISEFVDLAKSHVNAIVKRLVEIGVLERDRVPAPHGRSFMYIYRPVADFEVIRGLNISIETK